jgi:hypothetical protein
VLDDCLSSDLAVLRKRWGLGARHALFPRILAFGAPLHPSSAAGCQFPDATPVCKDDCKPFRPRSGARPGVTTMGFWVRLLSPEFSHLPVRSFQTRMDDSEKRVHPRQFRKVGIGPLVTIVGPAPRVLSLTPQVTFPSQADDFVFEASRRFEFYCNSAVTASLPTPSCRSLNSR